MDIALLLVVNCDIIIDGALWTRIQLHDIALNGDM